MLHTVIFKTDQFDDMDIGSADSVAAVQDIGTTGKDFVRPKFQEKIITLC